MKNKVAVVTGASRGIGKSIANTLAASSYDLLLCCSKEIQSLEKYADELSAKYNISCYTSQVDVANATQVHAFLQEGTALLGPVDVLINNAGISYVGLITDMTPEQWDLLIQTNLSSMFYFSKEVIPHMVHQQSGQILNISSVWGNVGASCEVAYSASKGGVNSFTKALAKELAPSKISVNAVACGMIDTSMNACFTAQEKTDIQEEIPFGRMASPDEVANFVQTILHAPNYLTGQIMTFDGGWC